MKKNCFISNLVVIASLCIVTCSCSHMDEDANLNVENTAEKVSENPYHLTIDEAQARLEQFIREMENSDSPDKLHFTSHQVTSRYATDLTPVMTRTGGMIIPCVYVFNFGNDEGYSVVSQDSRVNTPYVLTTSGQLVDNMTKYNYNEIVMLQMSDLTAKQVEAALQTIEPDNTEERMIVDVTNYPSGYPDGMCTTHWHQFYPYNKYCPVLENGEKAAAGGLVVALAQMMSIFQHPSSYTTTGLDTNETTYFNWRLMAAGSETGNDMTAKLMYYLGLPENLNVTYSTTRTSANTSNVPHTLVNFGYASGARISRFNANKALTELEAGRPTIVSHNAAMVPEEYDIMGLKVEYSDSMVTRSGGSELDSLFMPGVNVLVHGGRLIEYKWIPSGVVELTSRHLLCNLGNGEVGDGWFIVDYSRPGMMPTPTFPNTGATGEGNMAEAEPNSYELMISPNTGSGLDPSQYLILLGVTIVTGIQVAE